MIVELCGPPAAGKTTAARLLAADLREQGHQVGLVLSNRPSEADAGIGPFASAVRRVTRPAIEVFGACRAVWPWDEHNAVVTELIRLLPPANLFWSVRLRQYLLRVLRSWREAANSPLIVIFDQAFVQALASLVVLARAGAKDIAGAIQTIPKPDLLIRLHASEDVLKARLRKRSSRQGLFERRLELDLATNLRFVPALEELCVTFEAKVAPVIPLCTDDPVSRAAALVCIDQMAVRGPGVLSDTFVTGAHVGST